MAGAERRSMVAQSRTLAGKRLSVTWTLHEPDPSHCMAVGTVWQQQAAIRLLVGAGRTCEEAVTDLARRLEWLEALPEMAWEAVVPDLEPAYVEAGLA